MLGAGGTCWKKSKEVSVAGAGPVGQDSEKQG